VYVSVSVTLCVIVRGLEISKRGGLGPLWAVVPPKKKKVFRLGKERKRWTW
jgi:hypothetical protein